MELQVFDKAGGLRARLHPGAPPRAAVVAALHELAPGFDPDAPAAEAELDAEATAVLGGRVEERVRALRAALPREPEAGGYDETTVDVLGEPLTLNVRTPPHGDLLVTNRLLEGIRAAVETGGLRIIAVPPLGTREFYLATLLKEKPDGVPQARLPELLRSRIGAVADGMHEDARLSMQRDAGALADPRTLAGVVAGLRAQGLVEDRSDELVRPTPALRRMHV